MRLLAALALSSCLVACEGQEQAVSGPASPSAPIAGVAAVVVDGPSFVYRAATQTLVARVRLDSGELLAIEKATWASSAPSVAAVDKHGVLTGLSSGEAGITATVGTITGRLDIRVVPDYRGSWTGDLTLLSCRGYRCNPRMVGQSWRAELRLEQAGGGVTGRLLQSQGDYVSDFYGYLVGHIEQDGAFVVDRGLLDKWGGVDHRIATWRTMIEPDGGTMAGTYVIGDEILESTVQVNLRRAK